MDREAQRVANWQLGHCRKGGGRVYKHVISKEAPTKHTTFRFPAICCVALSRFRDKGREIDSGEVVLISSKR
jgi:hypothetical protein